MKQCIRRMNISKIQQVRTANKNSIKNGWFNKLQQFIKNTTFLEINMWYF